MADPSEPVARRKPQGAGTHSSARVGTSTGTPPVRHAAASDSERRVNATESDKGASRGQFERQREGSPPRTLGHVRLYHPRRVVGGRQALGRGRERQTKTRWATHADLPPHARVLPLGRHSDAPRKARRDGQLAEVTRCEMSRRHKGNLKPK